MGWTLFNGNYIGWIPIEGCPACRGSLQIEDEKRWLNFGGSIGPEGTLLEKTFLNQKMFVMQQCITKTNFRSVSQKITNAGQRNRA